MSQSLVIIDLQNDYFQSEGGSFPLHRADETLDNVLKLARKSKQMGLPCVLVQHIADTSAGPAPFFNPGSPGVELHAALKRELPDAPIVTKAFADSFHETTLDSVLRGQGATEVVLCGMMTQNCVTHTALSKSAERFQVSVVSDACGTVSDILHHIAIHALSTRVRLVDTDGAFQYVM